MNVLLWVLQVLLALHTAMGAVWKFSNSEQSVPSLAALPHAVWSAMSGLELLCSVLLVLPIITPLRARVGVLAPVAAAFVAAEMLLFCVVHLASGVSNHSELIYWLVVAGFCAFIAVGRFVLKPLE